MTTMAGFRNMAETMDQRVRQLAAKGVNGSELLHQMVGHLPDLQKIWDGTNDRQLATLCEDYPGFYQYASLMEDAAEAERANPTQASYKSLPQLDGELKSKLTELLTGAATLERRYQSLSTAKGDTPVERDELGRLHEIWLLNREDFIQSLGKANLPKAVSDFAVPALEQIAERIDKLKKPLSVQRK